MLARSFKNLLSAIAIPVVFGAAAYGQVDVLFNNLNPANFSLADSNGALLPIGSEIRIVNLASGGSIAATDFTDYTSITTNFQTTVGVTSSGGVTTQLGRGTDSETAVGTQGTPFFVWVFNTPSGQSSTATEWAFLHDDIWVVPQLGGLNMFLQTTTFDANDVLFGSIVDTQVRLAAVPEPATYAALLGVATLVIVGFRRFRRIKAA